MYNNSVTLGGGMTCRSRIPPFVVKISNRPKVFALSNNPEKSQCLEVRQRGRAAAKGLQHYENFHSKFAQIYNSSTIERTGKISMNIESFESFESFDGSVNSCIEEMVKVLDDLPISDDKEDDDSSPTGERTTIDHQSSESSATTSIILDDFTDDDTMRGLEVSQKTFVTCNSKVAMPPPPPSPSYYYSPSTSSTCDSPLSETPINLYLSSIPNSETSSLRYHRRRISQKIHNMISRVSGLASPRSQSRIVPRKSPAEAFRDSLAEANSQRDSFLDRYNSEYE